MPRYIPALASRFQIASTVGLEGGMMHPSSVAEMQRLISKYLAENCELNVLDVGACDVNGTYRPLFAKKFWKYTGADMAPGRNVDLVLAPEHGWGAMDSIEDRFDVVISGQVMEHVKNPFKFAADLERVCRPGGLCFVIAPWKCEVHHYPLDCWRILPDGMRHVMEESGFKTLECAIVNTDTVYAGVRLRGSV